MCNEWEYQYHECNGLKFIIHSDGEQDNLMFDIDYKNDLLLLDYGDEYEVVDPTETLRDFLGLGDN